VGFQLKKIKRNFMKRPYRKIIIIGLIFIILLSVWVLIGYKGGINLGNWKVSELKFLNFLNYIYEERTWIIPTIATFVVGFISTILYIISKEHKPSVNDPSKKAFEDIFGEEDITPLEVEKEERQAISTYLDRERTDIFHTLAPGSTNL
jgi:hypothetical protein